jgi:putative membrane protein insertion efficiency factor
MRSARPIVCMRSGVRVLGMDERRLPMWMRVGNVPFVLVIRLYRVTLSPFIGGQCRYEPTCSRYGLDAYRLYGPIRGTRLTLSRILRCHPFVKGGYDPVPIPEDGANGHEASDAQRKGPQDHESTPSRPTP